MYKPKSILIFLFSLSLTSTGCEKKVELGEDLNFVKKLTDLIEDCNSGNCSRVEKEGEEDPTSQENQGYYRPSTLD